MSSFEYLFFTVAGARFAIEAEAVAEIVWLPELNAIPGAPRFVIGAFNFRGRIAPVVDLAVWLDLDSAGYSVTQSLIVLREGEKALGIIADTVDEVETIPGTQIEPLPMYSEAGAPNQVLTRLAKQQEKIILLPDRRKLFRCAETAVLPSFDADEAPAANRSPAFDVGSEEGRAILRERARLLSREGSSETDRYTGLAVVALNGAYFGVPLEDIREFAELRGLTPVPCCPSHIVGNMNLRGDVVTVMDIRGALEMETAPAPAGKVMVLEFDEVTAGVEVEHVFEAVYLRPDEIAAVPAAAHAGQRYIVGAARYNDAVLHILDVHLLLANPKWIVDEDL